VRLDARSGWSEAKLDVQDTPLGVLPAQRTPLLTQPEPVVAGIPIVLFSNALRRRGWPGESVFTRGAAQPGPIQNPAPKAERRLGHNVTATLWT
jgi:hypothetical protein